MQAYDRGVVARMRLVDDIAPPHEHSEKDERETEPERERAAQAEKFRVRRSVRLHPHDGADRHDERRDGTDERPRTGVHQMIVVMFSVTVGHLQSPFPHLVAAIAWKPQQPVSSTIPVQEPLRTPTSGFSAGFSAAAFTFGRSTG